MSTELQEICLLFGKTKGGQLCKELSALNNL